MVLTAQEVLASMSRHRAKQTAEQTSSGALKRSWRRTPICGTTL